MRSPGKSSQMCQGNGIMHPAESVCTAFNDVQYFPSGSKTPFHTPRIAYDHFCVNKSMRKWAHYLRSGRGVFVAYC